MTLVGFLWFLGALPESDSALVFTLGLALGGLWAAPLVHLLVAFPTGQVKPGLERRLVWLGYGLALAAAARAPVRRGARIADCNGCPENLLLSSTVPTAHDVVDGRCSAFASVAMLAGVCVVLVAALAALRAGSAAGPGAGAVDRRGGRGRRRRERDPAGRGRATQVGRRVRHGADRADHGGAVRVPGGPAALVGLARGRARVAGGARRHDQRARRAGRGARRSRALARVLAPGPGRVRRRRRPSRRPRRRARSPRSTTTARRSPRSCTTPRCSRSPSSCAAAGAAAALALRNERLDAELRARYEELRASRARLVAAGDDARRRIERDLHDGAQQHLVSLALTLRLARLATEDGTKAATFLDAGDRRAQAGPRRAARAGPRHPPRGADRARPGGGARRPRRPRARAGDGHCRARRRGCRPRYESAAYFLVCEALTNVAKYADATTAEVSVGLSDGHVVIEVRDDGRRRRRSARRARASAGCADRVAALDGALVVESPPGAGTLVRAELPYREPALVA